MVGEQCDCRVCREFNMLILNGDDLSAKLRHALDILKIDRSVHEEWVAYFKAHPGEMRRGGGTLAHDQNWVGAYSQIISAIEDALSTLETNQ